MPESDNIAALAEQIADDCALDHSVKPVLVAYITAYRDFFANYQDPREGLYSSGDSLDTANKDWYSKLEAAEARLQEILGGNTVAAKVTFRQVKNGVEAAQRKGRMP